MPRILEAYDDLDWANGEHKTLASDTVTVGLDGETAELVLSDTNAEKIRKYLRELIAAGRKVETKMPRPSGQTRPAGKRAPKDQDKASHRARLRQWVDENNLRNPDDQSLPAYKTAPKNWNYPKYLTDKFDAWEADQKRIADAERVRE